MGIFVTPSFYAGNSIPRQGVNKMFPSITFSPDITREILKILKSYLPITLVEDLVNRGLIEEIETKVEEDLAAFASQDPAAKNSVEHIWNSYLSFRAVFYYRIAHLLYSMSSATDQITPLQIIARSISERAKVETAIEIHPGAKIGLRFVIDHGTGTVIGETTEIGDDCYILQGVIFGARGIARNHNRKRHPTLGNRVQVGAFVSILGDVTVGDDVKIAPHAVVKEDIPTNSKVLVLSTNQIIKN